MSKKTILVNLFKNHFFRNTVIFVAFLLLLLPFVMYKVVTTNMYGEIMFNISDDAKRVAKHLYSRHFNNLQANPYQGFNQIIKDFKVYKIKYFESDGKVSFSSEKKEIGTKNSHDYFYEKVTKGEIFFKVVKKGLKTLEGTTIESDVVEIYIPVMKGKKFVGSFELYYDITEQMDRYELLKTRIKFIQTTIVSTILLIIALMLYRASKSDLERTIAEKDLIEAKNRAIEASTAKSDFLSNISHEIRTPLNAIIGFIQFLIEEEDDEEKRKKLHIIDSSSKILLQLINDVLDFSKIESGKLEIERIPFPVKKEFELIKEIFDSLVQSKGVSFNCTIDENVPNMVISDPLRIKQITINLVSNAVKFTPKDGTIDLHISFNEGTSRLKVSVKDTGIGMDKNHLDKLFSPFVQGDGSITRKYGGTGLGLAISKELVHLMGGQIYVSSTKGEGSTFIFEIPLKKSAANFKMELSQNKEEKTGAVANEKKEELTQEEIEGLIGQLIDAVKTRRPVKCDEILEKLSRVKLSQTDFDLILKSEKMIKQYKFKEAEEILERDNG